MSSDSKRRRLSSLASIKGISSETLAKVVNLANKFGIETSTRKAIDKTYADCYSEVAHSIELPLNCGGKFLWEVSRLDRLVQLFCRDSQKFNHVMKLAAGRANPLHLILYVDEVTPGNLLRPDHKRKFHAIYVSFVEIGQSVLCKEEIWLPLALLRSTIASQVRGGMSNCMRLLLRSIFLQPCRAFAVGFPVDLEGPTLIRVTFGHFIADEAAIKSTWSFKGASGLRPCLRCKNIVSARSNLAHGDDYLLDITASDPSKFDPTDDQYIWKLFDDLHQRAATSTRRDFEILERACGVTYNEHSLLGDVELRSFFWGPASSTTYDPMHNFLVNGTFNLEVHLLLSCCKQTLDLSFADINQYIEAAWCWPKSHCTHKI